MDTEEVQPTELETRIAEILLDDDNEELMVSIETAAYQSLPEDIKMTGDEIAPYLVGIVVAAVEVHAEAYEDSDLALAIKSAPWRPYQVALLISDIVAAVVDQVIREDACPSSKIDEAIEDVIQARIALLQLGTEKELQGTDNWHAAMRAVASAANALGMSTVELNNETYRRANVGIGPRPA